MTKNLSTARQFVMVFLVLYESVSGWFTFPSGTFYVCRATWVKSVMQLVENINFTALSSSHLQSRTSTVLHAHTPVSAFTVRCRWTPA